MGYLWSRKQTLPEVIKKYAEAKLSQICEHSADIDKNCIELYNEVESWWSDCELYNKEDYPDLTLESLLPEMVVECRNGYYNTL